MKIAILTDSFPPYLSGISTYCIELVRQLVKKGHSVLVMAPNYGNDNINPFADIKTKKVKLVRLKSVRTMVSGFRICLPKTAGVIKEIKSFKADIIETEDPLFLGIDGLIASKILGIPCISTFHTLATSEEYLKVIFRIKNSNFKKIVWTYHRWFYNSSDIVFATTKETSSLLVKNGIYKSKVSTIPIFFDYYRTKILSEDEKKVLKKYYGLKEKVAVYLGRISQEKNLDTLIKIWKEVANEHPDSTLVIIGKGSYKKELENLVKKEKLDKNIRFLGEIEHEQLLSSGLLSIFDIYVSASISETFGLAGIEAMAHKLPPVLFRTQGLAEVVGNSGLLCSTNNKKSFKEAVLKLFKNDKMRILMGVRARKIAGFYDSNKATDKILKMYEKTIRKYTPSKVSLNYLSKISKIGINLDKYKKILKSLYV